mmetsp:Transcript_10150/g.26341  ORF Transcript_10150/g.26341 Transcript_10150/m.26341 type:complete len:234 (+) Transcript_10150:102-803(+)
MCAKSIVDRAGVGNAGPGASIATSVWDMHVESAWLRTVVRWWRAVRREGSACRRRGDGDEDVAQCWPVVEAGLELKSIAHEGCVDHVEHKRHAKAKRECAECKHLPAQLSSRVRLPARAGCTDPRDDGDDHGGSERGDVEDDGAQPVHHGGRERVPAEECADEPGARAVALARDREVGDGKSIEHARSASERVGSARNARLEHRTLARRAQAECARKEPDPHGSEFGHPADDQ